MIRLSHLCRISVSLIKKSGRKRYLKKWFRRLRKQKSRKMARNRNFDRNFSGISNLVEVAGLLFLFINIFWLGYSVGVTFSYCVQIFICQWQPVIEYSCNRMKQHEWKGTWEEVGGTTTGGEQAWGGVAQRWRSKFLLPVMDQWKRRVGWLFWVLG
jgi:hypothetical protein